MTSELNDSAALFVTERHMGILSTLGHRGGIHSVPVGFTVENGILRIITSDGTQKVRNVERGGTATVAQVHEGRWISFAGAASINRDADAVAHAVALYAGRYRQPRVNPIRVVIEITIEKTMGSADLFASGKSVA
ncbi:MAG: pyridoxamine 5'-phosphate oxidase family protein [Microterricola sp.]